MVYLHTCAGMHAHTVRSEENVLESLLSYLCVCLRVPADDSGRRVCMASTFICRVILPTHVTFITISTLLVSSVCSH